MRIARLAFVLTCCCCTATHGATYAGPAKLPSPKQSSESVSHSSSAETAAPVEQGRTSGKSSNERPASENHRGIRTNLTKTHHPGQLANNPRDFEARKAMNVHRPSTNAAMGAANEQAPQNNLNSQTTFVRRSGIVQPARPSPNNLRHRSSNPPTVGGAANTNARNAGAINGTRTWATSPEEFK